MQRGRFLKLVRRALTDLPEPFSTVLDNVDILVEKRPNKHHRQSVGLRPGETLFGLYECVPQTKRDSGYGMFLHDEDFDGRKFYAITA